MTSTPRVLLALLLAAVVLAALQHPSGRRPAGVLVAAPRFAAPTTASSAHGLTFDGVAPADQQVVLAAIAGAQPQARRLVDDVAGLVTLRVGPAGDVAGYAQTTPTGYDVLLDLGEVSRTLGTRGVNRLVLHELGHVVRFALVPDALLATLDAGIPVGYGCGNGREGACAPREERFAESFSKWAMNDIGADLDIGYRVPPPSYGLEAWAAPLTRLGR